MFPAHRSPYSAAAGGLEILIAGGLLLGLVFAPWAYGTTEPWSIAILNADGWCLVFLWLALKFVHSRNPKTGKRDGTVSQNQSASGSCSAGLGRPWPIRVLGWLTLAILFYELLAIVNAQAIYDAATHAFLPHAHVAWLPASLDPATSWQTLQRDVALAGTFWAAHAWLMGRRKQTAECPADLTESDKMTEPSGSGVPRATAVSTALGTRHQLLIWILLLNAVALGAEGLWQRRSGSNRLLFRVRPAINRHAEQQFGPYAYRGNAVQYFSMIWPLGLGLWAATHRTKEPLVQAPGRWLLLASASAVGIFPLLTRSRMGAVAGSGALLAAGTVMVATNWRDNWRQRTKMAGLCLLILVLGLTVGWTRISYRIHQGDYFADAGRTEIREAGWRMFRENLVYGTGPGTFETMYQLYRPTPSAIWYSQMHCDWLELLATFGIAGSSLVIGALVLLFVRWMTPGGTTAPGGLIAMAWLGLGSCLVHALVDFPFQIYSVLHLFVVICAWVSTLSLAPPSGHLRTS